MHVHLMPYVYPIFLPLLRLAMLDLSTLNRKINQTKSTYRQNSKSQSCHPTSLARWLASH